MVNCVFVLRLNRVYGVKIDSFEKYDDKLCCNGDFIYVIGFQKLDLKSFSDL